MLAYVQVIFLVRTNKTEDLQLLDLMLRDQPLQYKYKVISQPIAHANFDYSRMYEGLEDSQLYLKIDDDIVYIKVGRCASVVAWLALHDVLIAARHLLIHSALGSLVAPPLTGSILLCAACSYCSNCQSS